MGRKGAGGRLYRFMMLPLSFAAVRWGLAGFVGVMIAVALAMFMAGEV